MADLALTEALHAVVVRSVHAHASILGINTRASLAEPGVCAVLTAAEVRADGLGGIPWEVAPPGFTGPEGDPAAAAPQDLLAQDRVRYVGEPVALVVAHTLHEARSGAEALEIVYDPLPSVVTPAAAMAEGAPLLHASNVCFRFGHGDAAGTEKGFAAASVTVVLEAVNQRLVAAPIETRGYAGVWDSERWTLHAAAGKPHPIRRTLAGFVFGVPEDRIRVVVNDVGGGFGAKNVLYAEAALVLWAARRLGRPVRWQADRTEAFQSDVQGRDHTSTAAMAFAADGRILAVRIATLANLGAWLGPRAVNPAVSGVHILSGAYRIAAGRLDVTGVFTNTVPTCPYRGAGAPEIMFLIERLMDVGARRLGLPPDELRRRNVVRPEDMPYRSVGGVTYNDCDFPAVLARALTLSDWNGFAGRREEAAAKGMLRGIGLSLSLEAYGASLDEAATVRIDAAGAVTVLIGTQSSGQGHATAYAMLAAAALDLDPASIQVVQGDTDRVAHGNGTGASRSITVGGSAVVLACRRLVEVGLPAASGLLEAAVTDITFAHGCYVVAGTDRAVSLAMVAVHRSGWSAADVFRPRGFTFPYGCHVAEVEIDPDTGTALTVRYTAVQDCGVPVSPRIVAGQVQGGVAQGLGQALLERSVIDPDSGQLLSASLMDYALPRASDVPAVTTDLHQVPTAANPLSAKAVGEAGPTAAPPALINAIVDALAPFGVEHVEMPATAERLWRLMNGR